uniref:Uncharacterized protein n=1 Tax=Candidatus Kentrum sp. TC TaxID=2126339 RepID=A0A450YB94_9GAMM|nr:MAG: hypothetical protein BECKTC1821D_GA0114238_100560 [Candidatus Kentron sp. TC]
MCLSDGAILDLPPFSNFQRNVMWIDDYLKYALHRELWHLSQKLVRNKNGGVLTERVPDTHVFKKRPKVENAGYYTLGGYLPTVLYGAIMNAWIQPDHAANLPQTQQNSFPPGVLTRALEDALKTGWLNERNAPKLKDDLRRVAMERIAEVAEEWEKLKLKNGKGQSLAALWVTNPCASPIEDMDETIRKELKIEKEWIGWGLFKDPKSKLNDAENLNPKAREALDILIDDAVNYIEWTPEWPRFIQSVRAVHQGDLRFDLRWKGKISGGNQRIGK